MITEQDFSALGEEISREAGVMDGHHGYFVTHAPRLFKACFLFGLLENKLGHVLEIGPFFGYTPFLLRPASTSYTTLEVGDPVVEPLKPLYEKHGIKSHFADLFESFGPTSTAEHRLPFADCSFDTVLCWETMEHFNFNPVKFVKELFRVLKPGGRAHITVPNKASFQSILALISGRSERQLIEHYYTFEDYESGGKKAFHGFHWREYSAPELTLLYSHAGFVIEDCGTFVAFQARSGVSLPNKIARKANVVLARIFRRYGTHVYLTAARQHEA